MATDGFDPYYKWLGIPPSEQPPNHYRLLGIELFESDPEVIESAADQRMAHLRTFQSGKNAQLSQKLLNEVSRARICLLKPDTRQTYDEELRARLKPSQPSRPANESFHLTPPGQAGNNNRGNNENQTGNENPFSANQVDGDQVQVTISKSDTAYRKKNIWLPLAAVVLIIVLGVGGYLAYSGFFSGQQNLAANDGSTTDGVRVAQNSSNGNQNDSGPAKDNENNSQSPDHSGSSEKSNAKQPGTGKQNSGATSNPDTSGNPSGQPETNAADSRGKNPGTTAPKNNKSKADEKKPGDTKSMDPGKPDPNKPDPKKSAAPKSAADKNGKKGTSTEPGSGDDPVLFGKNNKSSDPDPAMLKNSPIPAAKDWQPYLPVLQKDFAIEQDMKRDPRFVLFDELISEALSEPKPARAYAIFMVALSQAKQLNYFSGIESYCTAFCERFEFDPDGARTAYLINLAKELDSEAPLAQMLVEFQKQIRRLEQEKRFDLSIKLLSTIVKMADETAGRNIDKSWFESWLAADTFLTQVQKNLPELEKRKKSNQLTAEQHRALGAWECFANGNFNEGLGHYQKCEFKPIADVARDALEVNISDIHSIAEIADQWWVLSTKVDAEEHLFRKRAKHWYDEYARLVSAAEISKKIQKRIEEASDRIGLTKITVPRSPTRVFLLDLEREITPGAVAEPAAIEILNNNLLAILAKDDSSGSAGTSFRLIQIDSQSEVFAETESGFIPHRIVRLPDRVAYLQPRQGLRAINLKNPPTRRNASRNWLIQASPGIRAFDISESGGVFALADRYVCGWPADAAWARQSRPAKPKRFELPVQFIPNRIQVIPNSSLLAISDRRNLVRLNPVNQTVSELVTNTEFGDYDFAANGIAVAIGKNDGLRYKAFKGSRDLFFKSARILKVRFLPNPRFVVTLHDDHSVRVWDVFQKDNDYLLEKLKSDDFKVTDFSISPDGSFIALTDATTRIRFFSLYFN